MCGHQVVNQVEAHVYLDQSGLQKDMADRGVVLEAYSPLGNVSPGTPDEPTPLDGKFRLAMLEDWRASLTAQCSQTRWYSS